jgi:hypothetical protein
MVNNICVGTIYNPEVGDIRYNWEINKKGRSIKYVYAECSVCKKRKWVEIYSYRKTLILRKSFMCQKCGSSSLNRRTLIANTDNPLWKMGVEYANKYRLVYISIDSTYSSMIGYKRNKHGGYIKEHRLIMAMYLGRCLQSWEVVHHKNHIRDDNSLENLELMVNNEHHVLTILENKVKYLEDDIKEQSKLVRLLLWMMIQIKSGVLLGNGNLLQID